MFATVVLCSFEFSFPDALSSHFCVVIFLVILPRQTFLIVVLSEYPYEDLVLEPIISKRIVATGKRNMFLTTRIPCNKAPTRAERPGHSADARGFCTLSLFTIFIA